MTILYSSNGITIYEINNYIFVKFPSRMKRIRDALLDLGFTFVDVSDSGVYEYWKIWKDYVNIDKLISLIKSLT